MLPKFKRHHCRHHVFNQHYLWMDHIRFKSLADSLPFILKALFPRFLLPFALHLVTSPRKNLLATSQSSGLGIHHIIINLIDSWSDFFGNFLAFQQF
jgi:hypothetical protein